MLDASGARRMVRDMLEGGGWEGGRAGTWLRYKWRAASQRKGLVSSLLPGVYVPEPLQPTKLGHRNNLFSKERDCAAPAPPVQQRL